MEKIAAFFSNPLGSIQAFINEAIGATVQTGSAGLSNFWHLIGLL